MAAPPPASLNFGRIRSVLRRNFFSLQGNFGGRRWDMVLRAVGRDSRIAAGVGPVTNFRPVISSKKQTPRDHMSDLSSAHRASSSCSGAMKEGVPSAVPSAVMSSAEPGLNAIPKSASFTTPSRRIRTFEGLTSLWTIPLE
jgi:hypothetical protein